MIVLDASVAAKLVLSEPHSDKALALLSVNDAHYLALAQNLGCDLWTDDQRLINSLAGRLPSLKWIGDYQQALPKP